MIKHDYIMLSRNKTSTSIFFIDKNWELAYNFGMLDMTINELEMIESCLTHHIEMAYDADCIADDVVMQQEAREHEQLHYKILKQLQSLRYQERYNIKAK